MATTTTSPFGALNVRDLVKGLIVAVIGAVLTTLYTALQTGTVDWKAVGLIAATTGISYLIKNLFTQQTTVVTPNPPPSNK